VATDILGVAGRAMLTALVAGTTDAAILADLARGNLRATLPALCPALTGRDEIAGHLPPFASEGIRLPTIPGVQRWTVENLLAEVGVVMPPFPTAGHLTSWAGLCPGTNASAGQPRRGRTRKGDRWLTITRLEAALAAIRVKGSALGARYRRICRHRGHKIALVAVARALLEIVWHLRTKGTTYHELGAAYLGRRDQEHTAQHYVRLLERLGHRVLLEPAPIAA
jgi:transposase